MIDWDDAFDNSGYVPEADSLIEVWTESAAKFRDQMAKDGRCDLDVIYGTHQRMRYDLFYPDKVAIGTAIFVHGGYWHSRAKSDWSHFANGFLEMGWALAVLEYPLAPQFRLAEITDAIAKAVRKIAETSTGPLRLFGHSAGGHLVTRMTNRGVLSRPVTERIERVVAISGVFDLRPLLETQMNETLRISVDEARSESPVLAELSRLPITFWVGANERPEFLRQTRLAAETYEGKGLAANAVYHPGRNHFSVLLDLAEKDGLLLQEILR